MLGIPIHTVVRSRGKIFLWSSDLGVKPPVVSLYIRVRAISHGDSQIAIHVSAIRNYNKLIKKYKLHSICLVTLPPKKEIQGIATGNN